jgi:hypothetical protein
LRLQQRKSKRVERVSSSCTNTSLSTELSAERYLRKLAGKTDVEDALKRLDKLTHEEAWMATAQVLRATHNVDDRVRGVDNKVTSVDERVKAVDVKVAEAVEGA